jgi:hypothetical protein
LDKVSTDPILRQSYYPTTVTTDFAGTVIVNAPEKTPSALSCAWFSLADVRYGVTLAGAFDRPLRFTVTVCEVLPVFASTTVTAPLAGLTAVTCSVESLDVDNSKTEFGRMNRLN